MTTFTHRLPLRLTPFSIFGLLLAVVACGTITVDIRTEIRSRQEIVQNVEYIISGPIAQLFITNGEIDLDAQVEMTELDSIEAAGWDLKMDVEQVDGEDALVMRLSQTFTGEDAAEQFRLASEALAEGDTTTSMIPFLEITENEDEIVYQLSMSVSVDDESSGPADGDIVPTLEPLIIDGTPFPGLPDFGDTGATGDAVDLGGLFSGEDDFADALASSFEEFITVNWSVVMPGRVTESNATAEKDGRLTWELNLAQISETDSDLFATSIVNKSTGGSCNR